MGTGIVALIVVLPTLGVLLCHAFPGSDAKDEPSTERSFPFLSNRESPQFPASDAASPQGWRYCYQKDCWCRGDTANCSFSNLTYIPKLPDNIEFLNFSNNHMQAITDDDFFDNVTGLVGLCLSRNGLTDISAAAFRKFTNMTYLNLGYNSLTLDALESALTIPTLRYLDVVSCGLRRLPENLFTKYKLPYLEELFLESNDLKQVHAAFSSLPSLKLLNLGENHLTRLLHEHTFPKLYKINLSHNSMYRLPQTCSGTDSLYPVLRSLDLTSNNIEGKTFRHHEICLPSLEWLDLSGNRISELTTDMFSLKGLPNLRHLVLQSMNTHFKSIEKYAFRHPKLQSISLIYNGIEFSDVSHPQCFQGCPSLTSLQVSRNELGQEVFMDRIGNLTTLRELYMGSCRLKRFSADTFARLTRLEKLELYRNDLSSIPDGAFDNLKNLTKVDLSNNLISSVQETAFGADTRKQLLHVDLSGNPFDCDCDLLWFKNWLVSDPSLFRDSWSAYVCSNFLNTTVQSFHVVEQTCLLNTDVSFFLSITVSMLLCVISLAILFHRYRWHLRLVLYEAFRGRRGGRWRQLQAEEYQYDVFVSFASEDMEWVSEHLMPELEDKMGLKLCIHERDFVPGYPIVDNIADSVEASKKVMMIFSKHFTRSQWCQFELNFCLDHVLKNDDALLVVCLEDLTSRDLTTAMMAVLSATTYIQWGNNCDARNSFWGRLRIALEEVMSDDRR